MASGHVVSRTSGQNVINAIGLLAIYFGCLENALDKTIAQSRSLITLPPNIDSWMFTSKVERLKKALRSHLTRDEKDLLSECRAVAKDRNDIIPSFIVSDRKGGAVQVTESRRTPLNAAEIRVLAEHVLCLRGGLMHLQARIELLSARERETGETDNSSERPDRPAQWVADETAEVVADAREMGIDDETILAQLQDAAEALREGLT
jgi:hypothetical protein